MQYRSARTSETLLMPEVYLIRWADHPLHCSDAGCQRGLGAKVTVIEAVLLLPGDPFTKAPHARPVITLWTTTGLDHFAEPISHGNSPSVVEEHFLTT